MAELRRRWSLWAAVCPMGAALCCAWTPGSEAQSRAHSEWSSAVPVAAAPSNTAAVYPDQGKAYASPAADGQPPSSLAPPTYAPYHDPAAEMIPGASVFGDWERDDLETASLDAPSPTVPQPSRVWTLDYRRRSIWSSHTSYEFGTPEPPPAGWTPLSRLDFPLNSFWHGAAVGIERPRWAIHLEWLTPVNRSIQGDFEDYDWVPPNPDSSFTDLGLARQRWFKAQMLDLGLEFRLGDRLLSMPIEVWPACGFRWQRFGIMCYDLVQVKEDNVWPTPPYSYQGDVISLKQDYYIGYVGGQLRMTLASHAIPPVRLAVQGDWGPVSAHNVDHHLIREGDRYTMETTSGDAWHVALSAEALITRWLSLGFQVDHLQIRTTGWHRWLNVPEGIDETWDHGVRVWSDQTWLAGFIGLRI